MRYPYASNDEDGVTDEDGEFDGALGVGEKFMEEEFKLELKGEDIIVESQGGGVENPVLPNDSIENRKANRRVEAFWSPKE